MFQNREILRTFAKIAIFDFCNYLKMRYVF
jgi:hypothetical protein